MLLGIISSQIIDTTIAPKIDVLTSETEGRATFHITNMSAKYALITYGIQGSGNTEEVNLAPSAVFLKNFDGTPGASFTLEAYAQASDENKSTTTTAEGIYYLPRTVATPSITSSAGPSVGQATFVIKNEDMDAVTLHYRQAGGDWTNLGSTSSGLTRQVILTGDPNTMVTLHAKATPITLPAYESDIAIKGQLTKNYEGTSIAPSIVQQPYVALGWIKVQFQNNDGLGTLYYRRSGESWSTVQLMTGETLDVTYSGTQGAYVEVSAYFKADIKLASSTTIFGGYYYRNSTPPSITSTQGATAGIAIFTITNQDSATAEMFYRNWYSGIGAEVGWISLGNVNSGLTKQQSLTGNPGSTLTLEARVRAVNNAAMSTSTSKSQVTKDRAASPTITSRPNDVPGRIIVRIINAESTSGTLYYRRDSESYTSYAVSGSGYIDVTYTGTPKGSITVQAYYVTSGKDPSQTTTYYGYYLKPADVELYNKYQPGGNWQTIYNTCSANVNILSNPLTTYDYLGVSTLYSYYDTSTYSEAWAQTQDNITSYGTHYRSHVVITVASSGAISVQPYGDGPDGGFLNGNRIMIIYGKYN